MNKLSLKEKIFVTVLTLLAVVVSGLIIAKLGTISFFMMAILFVAIFAVFKIFKDPFWGFCSIVFFLPYERIPTYNLAGVDIKINTVLGFIVLVAWILALAYNGKKWKIQPNYLSIPLGLFVMGIMLSLTQALNLDRAYEVTIFVLFTISLSVLATNMVSTKENLQKIIRVLLFSSLIVGAFGLFQFAGNVIGLPDTITFLKQGYDSRVFGFPRIQAFSMEPLYFADYLFLPICLGMAYFFGEAKDFVNRWWILGLTVLLLINFILTVSRGAYLGFVFSFLVLGVLMFKKIFTWKHILIICFSILVLGYSVAFALSNGDTRATNEFINHILVKDYTVGESVQGRLTASNEAYQAYLSSPVFGIGMGNYGPYAKSYPLNTPKDGWDIVNNEYMEILAETGTVGIVCFSLILLFLAYRSLRAILMAKDTYLKLTMMGELAAFIGILVQYAFFSTLYIIHIWVLIGLMVGTQNLIIKQKSEIRMLASRGNFLPKIINDE